jgi:hypothetical protein
MKTVVLFAAMFFLATTVRAATITVAPSGGDYTTIQAALNAAQAGDTVLVGAGTYTEHVSFPRSGSAGNYITLQSTAGAIVDGTGQGELGMYISSKNYIKVIGMTIRNFKGGNTPIGISIDGSSSHLEIRNNLVYYIENANKNAHGIAFYGDSSTPISDILVDGNEIRNCKLGQSESMVLNGNVTNFTVSHNVIHDNDNIGIDFIGYEGTGPSGSDRAHDGICVDNIVYNISSGSNPTYTDRCADGIYVDGGYNIVIERNKVDNCDIGIETASEHKNGTTDHITVRNNFVSRSYLSNIMMGGSGTNNGGAQSIHVLNNTLYQGNDGEIELQNNCTTDILIKNNIFSAKSGNPYLQQSGSNNGGLVAGNVDNNLYYGAGTTPGLSTDAHGIFSKDPKLVLGGSPTLDLHVLDNTSPAVNAGTDLGSDAGSLDIDSVARVQGTAIDVGADEYVASGPRPNPPTGLTAVVH